MKHTYQADIIDLLQTVKNKDDNLTETEEEHEEWGWPAAVLVLKILIIFYTFTLKGINAICSVTWYVYL